MDFGTKPTLTVPKQPSDTSFPTVIPDPPIFQHRGPAGEQAQWLVDIALGHLIDYSRIVFALMLILSLAFMFLSWSLPAVGRLAI
jgi:hypothetical protein